MFESLKKNLTHPDTVTKELMQDWLTKFSEKIDQQAQQLAQDLSVEIAKLQGRLTALENLLQTKPKKTRGRPRGPYQKRKVSTGSKNV